ncbi:EAL domain-containing protein [Falsigemmobacter faecalis]|nr:EAL domain-containing protein [Falsigemmobacter faecalis]
MAGSATTQLAIEAIRQRLAQTPPPGGFCLFVLENMDLVEVAGDAGAARILRNRIRGELENTLGAGSVLCDAREDGFILALPATDQDHLMRELDHMLHRLPFWSLDRPSHATSVTGRAGVVWVEDALRSKPEDLHRAAVTAVSAARVAQRSRLVFGGSDPRAITDLQLTAQLICDLPAAVEEGRLVLLGQEIVSCAPGAARGREYEVLLQMNGRSGQSFAPGFFLQAAEQSRLIEIVDNWVLRSVLVENAARLRALPDMKVSINVAARTLSGSAFAGGLEAMLKAGGVDPTRIQLEITETAQIRDLQQAQSNIRAARSMGCRIALDDFGAGMSGYGYLKAFEPDCLKIDGSLISHVADETHMDARIVRSIITLAHDLGIEVVAEHVSSQDILQALKGFGIDKVQGFQLGRPGPLQLVFENRQACDSVSCAV